MSSGEANTLVDDFTLLGDIHCLILSATALVYDICITSDREVACVWTRKCSVVTIVFLNMRYVTLISQIGYVTFCIQPGVLLPCKAAAYIMFSASIWSSIVAAGMCYHNLTSTTLDA